MSTLDLSTLDAIEQRAAATTPGPWIADGIEVWTEGETVLGGTIHTTDDGYPRGDYHPTEDADFIAHAKQDIPALAEAVRRLLELHKPVDEPVNLTVMARRCEHDRHRWPCPTVSALEGVIRE